VKKENLNYLKQELENFEKISKILITPPGEIPELKYIDIYGESIPLYGVVGGDHIIYVDFNKRYDLESRISLAEKGGKEDIKKHLISNKSRAGILIADVSGHSITDAYLAGRLHDAFLTGVLYELESSGEITLRLFETLNTRFYNASTIDKYLTMIYGEISETGMFRFISAGHPPPVVFSNKYDKLIEISKDRLITFPPLGMFPSKEDIDKKLHISLLGYKEKYTINELNLMGSGDIILLYTDGLSEHQNNRETYFPFVLEETLRRIKHLSSREIFANLKEDIIKFASPKDDFSFVVIKRTSTVD